MKEKTFEELIEENTNWTKATLGGHEKTISTKKCLKLMQQVREATIAECYKEVEKSKLIVDAMTKIHYLPTDRIRIEP